MTTKMTDPSDYWPAAAKTPDRPLDQPDEIDVTIPGGTEVIRSLPRKLAQELIDEELSENYVKCRV